MSTFSRKYIDKACLASLGLLLISLLTALVHYPLTWGLMDDAQTLRAVKITWSHLSLFELLHRHSVDTIFRPVYVAYLYVFYGAFQNSPKLFYVFTFFLLLLIIWPWALILRRHLRPASRQALLILFSLLLLACTPIYNLLVYLSLQEKFVIGFGGWCLYALTTAESFENQPKRWWLLQGTSFACFLLGLFGKPTTIIFAPWGLAALAFNSRAGWKGRSFWAVLWLTLTISMGSVFLRRSDSYTSKYATNAGVLFERLGHQPVMVYLLLALALVTALVVAMDRRDDQDALLRHWPSRWLWPCCLICYLAVLVPWGISTYLWAPAMVLACGCVVLVVDWVIEKWPRFGSSALNLGMPVAVLVAAVVVFHIAIPRLARQAEIGEVVAWMAPRFPNVRTDVFIMAPCMEAAGALEYYAGNTQTIAYLPKGEPALSTRPKRWLITRDECPIDPAHTAQFDRVIFQLPHWIIYEGGERDGIQ